LRYFGTTMALVCSISNEVPESPVISPVSGSVFERRLIEKYLQENGEKDPVNGEPLTSDMLIDIKTPPFVKAKPPTYTSIPGILKSLQDEWDAVMMHSFTMKQQLQTARQELSHALYQHDAACRVIARLTKEVTAAREALATLKPQQPSYMPTSSISNDETVVVPTLEVIGISQEVHQKLQDTASVLTQERKRKGKSIPEDLYTPEAIQNFTAVSSFNGLHSASAPGILCLDLQRTTVVTGGNDKAVTVFNLDTEQIVTIMKGHSKKVMSVVLHPNTELALSGSMDSTVKLWNIPNSQLLNSFSAHDGTITGLSLHATGDYVLISSIDHYWSFCDLHTCSVLAKVCGDKESPLTSAKFHPDGLIFATGTINAQVKIWDLKEQSNVANFSGHGGPITAISFSENGYYLATASDDCSVKLWDLRKLKNFKTIQMEDGFSITDLSFDQSGSYLSFSGSDIRVYGCKLWNEITAFRHHSTLATGVRFGRNASFIASTSMDRSLKIYSAERPAYGQDY